MRYTVEHVEATRARVLDACERQFRRHGFGGVGVDALARAAGVTTGAFYNHLGSKTGAFATVVAAGVARAGHRLEAARRAFGATWVGRAAAYYLGAEHRGDVAGGCILPSLSIDVSRADPVTRTVYETELAKTADMIAEGLNGGSDRRAAWPVLAQLVGGVVLARAVISADLAQEIAESVRDAIIAAEARAQAA